MIDKKRINLALVLVLILFSIFTQVSSVFADGNPDDIYWQNGFEPIWNVPDYNWASPLHKYQGKIIAGGLFEGAGATLANNIVSWDPENGQWSPLGEGVNQQVSALEEYHGSLIAGGDFTIAGGITTESVAAWDGNAWSALGIGIHGRVFSMVVWNDKLWVGGLFDSVEGTKCGNVAMWDGNVWHPLGLGTSTSYGKRVYDLCVYQNKLIVSGSFDSAGGLPANNIAAWDGTSWSTLGGGTNRTVYSAIVYDSSLVVGGTFDSASGVSADHIAQWNGNSWEPFGQATRYTVWKLGTLGNNLVASGDFDSIGGVAVRCIALYDGVNWKPIDTGLSQPAHALLDDDGKLIASGFFSTPLYKFTFATWDSTNGWKPELGNGFDNPVFDIHTYNGKAVLGGAFRMVDKQPFSKITLWDGNQFSSIGAGINFPNIYQSVLALTEYDNKLIAAGNFRAAAGDSVKSIAAWNGSTWSALNDGLPNAIVYCLTVFDGKLIAGGDFKVVAGQDTLWALGAWDGNNWSSLGHFVSSSWIPVIHDIEVFNSQLIAVGSFSSVDGVPTNNVAAWDGNAWTALGNGLGSASNELCYVIGEYNNQLIVGGTFTSSGSVPIQTIARWNGSTWLPLGNGMSGSSNYDVVDALCIYNNMLIAGGSFKTAGSIIANNIAAWDGTMWSALGSGIGKQVNVFPFSASFGFDPRVRALEVYNDKLLVGGDFTNAGDKFSCGFAVWSKGAPTGTGDDRPTELPDGYRLAQNYPNPFNPSTQIEYELPTKSRVLVTIYNLLGQQVRTLVDEEQPAGSHTISWDGRTDSGAKTATGMYLYRVEAGAFSQTKKMILLK